MDCAESPARFRWTRRRLLEFLLMLSAWLPARVVLAAGTGETNPAARSLTAFLDVLLPADRSPSASGIGVDAALLAQAREDDQLARLIELGCGWLDAEARKHGADTFYQLPEAEQIDVVAEAEKQSPRTLPRVFFNDLRRRAFGHYYADARIWADLRYDGPPQPKGFADHEKPLPRG